MHQEARLAGVRRARGEACRDRCIRWHGEGERTRVRLWRCSRIVEGQPDVVCGVGGEKARRRVIDRCHSICFSGGDGHRARVQSGLEGGRIQDDAAVIPVIDGES